MKADSKQVMEIVVSGERRQLALSLGNGKIAVTDLSTGVEKFTLKGLKAFPVYSPDGTRLAVSSMENGIMTVQIVDSDTGKVVFIIDESAKPLAFTPEGNL